jgi:hypothetical protein
MPAGRPTNYEPRFCQEIIDFFNQPLTQKTEDGKVVGCELPQLVNFAQKIGVDYSTLTRWRDKHEEFRNAYIQVLKIQEALLVGNAIQNRYNPYFAQFMLKNCHGWKDRQEVDQTNKNIEIKIDSDETNV